MNDQTGELEFQEPIDPRLSAWKDIQPKLGRLQEKVFQVIRSAGIVGATDEEIQDRLNMKSQTENPRRIELVKMGLVQDSMRRRKLKSGKMGTIWIVAKREAAE